MLAARLSRAAFIAGPLLALLLAAYLWERGLSPESAITASVTVGCVVWWVFEPVPIPFTSLIPLALFPMLGILTPAQVGQSYGSPLILLLLGGFILSRAMEHSGAHRRIALSMVGLFGAHSDRRLVFGFMAASAVLSMWISNTATTLMLLPVALAVLAALAALFPWELGEKADPFAPAYKDIRPEWYFMFMFETLKLVPGGEIGGVEFEALEVATQILAGGRGSRRHRRLVREEQAAQDVAFFALPLVAGSSISAGWVTARPETDAAAVEALLDEELARMSREPVTDDELARAHALIESSDWVTVHVPLGADTRGMIGAGEIAAMKDGVILINCARGGIVNQRDLLEALNRGLIAGAALDGGHGSPAGRVRALPGPVRRRTVPRDGRTQSCPCRNARRPR